MAPGSARDQKVQGFHGPPWWRTRPSNTHQKAAARATTTTTTTTCLTSDHGSCAVQLSGRKKKVPGFLCFRCFRWNRTSSELELELELVLLEEQRPAVASVLSLHARELDTVPLPRRRGQANRHAMRDWKLQVAHHLDPVLLQHTYLSSCCTRGAGYSR